jgi:hypothetical protein
VPHGLDCYFPEFQSFQETIGAYQVVRPSSPFTLTLFTSEIAT